MPLQERRVPVPIIKPDSTLPPFSDFYQIVINNPTSLPFVQNLGNAGLDEDQLEHLKEESHQKARIHKPRLPKLPPEALNILSAPAAGKDAGGTKGCPPSCEENRRIMQTMFQQVVQEKELLTQRISKIQEDKEDAERIAHEIETESKAGVELGKQLKVEIMREQVKEAQLKDVVRKAGEVKRDLEQQMGKLEAELQRRKHDLSELEAQLRVLHWSSGKSKDAPVPKPGNQEHAEEVSGEKIVAPRPATSSESRKPSTASLEGMQDLTRPLSRRYLTLAEDHTVDVMEYELTVNPQPAPRAFTAPAGLSRLIDPMPGAHIRCATPMFEFIEHTDGLPGTRSRLHTSKSESSYSLPSLQINKQPKLRLHQRLAAARLRGHKRHPSLGVPKLKPPPQGPKLSKLQELKRRALAAPSLPSDNNMPKTSVVLSA